MRYKHPCIFFHITASCSFNIFSLKGKKSVGVSRQWLGRLGKVDNGQVGVFSALCKGSHVVPVDSRLYLPEEWINDPQRCIEVKVPIEKVVLRPKINWHWRLVAHAQELGLLYDWVGADAGYGKGLGFSLELEKMNETFMVDIHSDQLIYNEKPPHAFPAQKAVVENPRTIKLTTRESAWTSG